MKKFCLYIAALAAMLVACAPKSQSSEPVKKAIVVCFSATGTTENVAKMIAKSAKCEYMPIEPKNEYSAADLDWTVETSRCCRENADASSRPEIIKSKQDLNDYDIVFIGYPIWWNLAPRIVNTFIENYNLDGKTIVPFATSGGSGVNNSVEVLRNTYPQLNIVDGELLNHKSQSEIDKWVSTIR